MVPLEEAEIQAKVAEVQNKGLLNKLINKKEMCGSRGNGRVLETLSNHEGIRLRKPKCSWS